MTRDEYATVAAEEMADVLRSVADRIERTPLLAISQIAEELETLARQTSDNMIAAQMLGTRFALGEKYLAEVGE